jgi:hypothetical protein
MGKAVELKIRARLAVKIPYGHGRPTADLGMGKAVELKIRARLAVAILYGHGQLPPSFRGRSLEDALSLFPSYPQGPIDPEQDRLFVGAVRKAMPVLRDLDEELVGLVEQLDRAPLSVIAARDIRSPDDRETTWLTVTEAARVTGVNTGVITHAADAGQLKSNGKQGRARRIDPAGLTRWQLERANKKEPEESDEHVKRQVDKHVRD